LALHCASLAGALVLAGIAEDDTRLNASERQGLRRLCCRCGGTNVVPIFVHPANLEIKGGVVAVTCHLWPLLH